MPTITKLTDRDLILPRASFLPEDDAALIRAVYDGKSLSEIARLSSQARGSIRKRFLRLRARLSSPTFELALRHRHRFLAQRRAVLTLCIIEGRPLAHAARLLRITPYQVRLHRDAILELLNADTSDLLTGGAA